MHAIELMARLDAWHLSLKQWCTKQDKNVFLYATCFCLLVCKMSVQTAEICRVDTLDWIAPLYVINHETFCCFIRSEQKSTTRRKKTKSRWKQCLPKASECVKCLLLYESILLGEKTKTSHSHHPLPPPPQKKEEKKGLLETLKPILGGNYLSSFSQSGFLYLTLDLLLFSCSNMQEMCWKLWLCCSSFMLYSCSRWVFCLVFLLME